MVPAALGPVKSNQRILAILPTLTAIRRTNGKLLAPAGHPSD